MEKLSDMPIERLRRKANKHWEMAGCARHDRDYKDEKKHTDLAKKYDDEVRRRFAESSEVGAR